MPTQQIYQRESSLVEKSVPWMSILFVFLLIVLIVLWWHARSNDVNNPVSTPKLAVANTTPTNQPIIITNQQPVVITTTKKHKPTEEKH